MTARCVILLGLLAGCGAGGPADRPPEAAAADPHAADADARVSLSEDAVVAAGIATEDVRSDAPEQALDVPGQIEFDPRRVALIATRGAGRVEQLAVVEGDRVRAGQVLARLASPAFQTAQTDFLLAVRRVAQLAGTPDEAGAAAVLRASRRRLALLGVAPEEIARLEGGGEPADHLVVTAPFTASIVDAPVLAGATVEAGTVLFRIADLSVVDVVAQVPERALPLVRVDQPATVAIAAYPDLRFAGQVERLHDELDQATRTLGAVIHVPNPRRQLRPGMFATVRFRITAGPVLTVAEGAVVVAGASRYVFVEVAPRTFERREVEVASLALAGSSAPADGRVAVRRGLVAGERVVVRGAFTLKSEMAKAALAEDEH
jgi:RND family efflux transporter MFP subunit